jgi:hypothetical protein
MWARKCLFPAAAECADLFHASSTEPDLPYMWLCQHDTPRIRADETTAQAGLSHLLAKTKILGEFFYVDFPEAADYPIGAVLQKPLRVIAAIDTEH